MVGGEQGVREGEVAFADEEDPVVRVEGDCGRVVVLLVVLVMVVVRRGFEGWFGGGGCGLGFGFGVGMGMGSGGWFAFVGFGVGFGPHC